MFNFLLKCLLGKMILEEESFIIIILRVLLGICRTILSMMEWLWLWGHSFSWKTWIFIIVAICILSYLIANLVSAAPI